MKHLPWTAALAGMGLSLAASAHIQFLDLNGPANHLRTAFNGVPVADACAGLKTGCMSSATITRFGWANGTTEHLGDSHNVTTDAEVWVFHLDQPRTVTITMLQAQPGLDPAFSLYAGLLPAKAHDDVPADPLQPKGRIPPFPKAPSPTDARQTASGGPDIQPASYHSHDGYRDTANRSYAGQFDAFADWSMANTGGQWAKITYITSSSGTAVELKDASGASHRWGGNGNHETAAGTGESLSLELPAGDYTIVAGGEACTSEAANGGDAAIPCSGPKLYGTVKITLKPPVAAAKRPSGPATPKARNHRH